MHLLLLAAERCGSTHSAMLGCSSECDVRSWLPLCVLHIQPSSQSSEHPVRLSWTRTSHPRDTHPSRKGIRFSSRRGKGVVVHVLNATFEDARRAANHRRGVSGMTASLADYAVFDRCGAFLCRRCCWGRERQGAVTRIVAVSSLHA